MSYSTNYYQPKGRNSAYSIDDKPYYNPGRTFRNIPKPKTIKFSTPVTLEKLDDEYFISTHNKKELKEYLIELEKQLTNILLFTHEPKNSTLNYQYPFSYYDPTAEEKIIKVKKLKEKIQKIKKALNLSSDVDFFITIKNNTFPQHSGDILNHYNESYSIVNKNVGEPKILNGNFTQLDDVYNIRKVHLSKAEKKDPYNIFKNLNVGYHNQILDYIIKQQNIKQEENKDPNCLEKELAEDPQQKFLKDALKQHHEDTKIQAEQKRENRLNKSGEATDEDSEQNDSEEDES